ncbi:MAG: hypothetical protein PHQ04_11020 [Opitutaceae bacterium]|nr:hypothetical protein [Opitutaceae bacterium]
MSSNESSGASAEGTATPPPAADSTAVPSSFGTGRGSGLARGRRPTPSSPTSTPAAPTDYTPTAIEIINAPREYKNPFAPPAAPPEPAPATPPTVTEPAAPAPVVSDSTPPATGTPPAGIAGPTLDTAAPAVPELFPLDKTAEAASVDATKAELKILPPEKQRATPAQTWESASFRPQREPYGERQRRNGRPPRDRDQFRHERPENRRPEASLPPAESTAEEPKKSGGLFGWVKSFFGGESKENPPAEGATAAQPSREGEFRGQRHRRHRGGRGRGRGGPNQDQGGGGQRGGEGQPREGEFRGQRHGRNRRHRGGQGRGGQYRGEYHGGGQGGGQPT